MNGLSSKILASKISKPVELALLVKCSLLSLDFLLLLLRLQNIIPYVIYANLMILLQGYSTTMAPLKIIAILEVLSSSLQSNTDPKLRYSTLPQFKNVFTLSIYRQCPKNMFSLTRSAIPFFASLLNQQLPRLVPLLQCWLLAAYNQQYYQLAMSKEDVNFEKIETSQNHDLRVQHQQRHFGLTLPIGWLENGEPKYLLGPHYLVFVVTLLLTSVIFIILGYSIASGAKVNQLEIAIAIFLSMVFYIYSYVRVGFSNPGIASSVGELSEEEKKNNRYCRPCKIIRPLGTVHCFSCDICIHGYDHHCPWVGKCIGRDNMGDFKRFLLSIMTALVTFALCIYYSGN